MIPSNAKDINETLALELLKQYSEKYLFYKRIQLTSFPDLYNEDKKSAVEVTSDMSDECWKRVMRKSSFKSNELLIVSQDDREVRLSPRLDNFY